MKAAVFTRAGEARKRAMELPEDPFDGTVNEAALHQVVTGIRAHQRQGTHATKTRSTVSGGSRKPWRQKGTGRARAGSIRSPLWRGGAVSFGPQPRSYDPKIPKKLKRLAIRSALNARAADGDLVVVEAFELAEPSTKAIVGLLETIGREGRNVLLLTDGASRVVHLSARNIPGVRVMPWGDASAYDVLWAGLILVEEGALGAPAESGDAS